MIMLEKPKKLIKKGIALFGKIRDRVYPFYSKIIGDNVFAIAGQSAFFLLLSLVPLLMFAVSILQSLNIPLKTIEESVNSVLTEQASDWFVSYLTNMYESAVGISVVSLFFTLWSAAQGIHAITNGLNRVHNTYENRNWFLLRFRAMLYTIVYFVIVLATVMLIVFGRSFEGLILPQLHIVRLLYRARYIIVYVYLVTLFLLAYRNLPNLTRADRKKFGIRCQLPGALFCATSWIVLAWAIGIYVDDFNGYSIYGGLTRVAVVMIWLYFCMVCLMLGAEFNFFFHDKIDRITGKIFKRKKKPAKKEKDIDNSK